MDASVASVDLGLCPQRLAQLRQVFQAEIDRQRLPGAVLAIARHGQPAFFEALGQQDPTTGVPMAPDSIFRIYSMTKPVVSVAALMLMERGQLLLGDSLAKWLPEFAAMQVAVECPSGTVLQPARQAITVHDLLRHTAGFTYEFLGDSRVQQQYRQRRIGARERSNAEFASELARIPLQFEPGTVWGYGRATDVLGRVVEVASGQPLGAFLQTEIFAPLGMVDTGFAVPAAQQHRIAEPFAKDPDGQPAMHLLEPRRVPAMEAGGGGLMSTAADYARFLDCLLAKGERQGVRLLGPRTVDFMVADHLGALPADGTLLSPGYGFGLGVAVRTAAGLASGPGSVGMYHWSGIAGTTFFVDPAENLWAMLLVQAPNQRDEYRQRFRNLVYAALTD
ncbi:MAG TPA: serine hydrolase domain-containing protein [Burkholderiaceae bacterium]